MRWASAFRYLPMDVGAPLGETENLTQRVTFLNNLKGNRVRLGLSNRFSPWPLSMEQITVRVSRDGAVSQNREITLRGSRQIRLEPGQWVYSDELAVTVEPRDELEVSIWIKDRQTIGSVCGLWSDAAGTVSHSVFDSGCFKDVPIGEIFPMAAATRGMFFFGFSAFQVYADDQVQTIAAFGDSITQMSFWTGPLQRILCAGRPGQAVLLNCGITGNRLLRDATYVPDMPGRGQCFGPAGIARFEPDVFGDERVDAVLVLEGANDLLHPLQYEGVSPPPTADELIRGYKRLTAIAHRHGARTYGLTLTPMAESSWPPQWTAQVEQTRRTVNSWMRDGSCFDGWFDADAALRDEIVPERVRLDCHIGDSLHPNSLGGERIAQAIDLNKLLNGGE